MVKFETIIRMETKHSIFPEELTRVLSDKSITDDDIKNHDTYITKYCGESLELVPIAKWIVSSDVMKNHGKFCNRSILKKYSKIVTQPIDAPKHETLDDADEPLKKIIVFNAIISENVWNSINDKSTLNGLHELLTTFQIFDISLTPATQKKIASNYLEDIKERGKEDWEKINEFDISVIDDCAFLCNSSAIDLISKNNLSIERLDSYFARRAQNASDVKIDSERMKNFVLGLGNIPKFESVISADKFAEMLDICIEMQYYYLFSEIYCTIISTPGSTYIFDIRVAQVYNKWLNKFRSREDEFKKNDRAHETFQYMAVRYTYLSEIMEMYKMPGKGKLDEKNNSVNSIDIDESLNFLCPCYMTPVNPAKFHRESLCDDMKCHCRVKILPLNKIKERINIFIGGYLADLDLTKSVITGSAMTACIFELESMHDLQKYGFDFNDYINILYGKTQTTYDKDKYSDHEIYSMFSKYREDPKIFSVESKLDMIDIQYGDQKKTFKTISGTDVDIMVNTDDVGEFDKIAQNHINAIRKKYPQVVEKKITTHNGNHKYKVFFPNFEQRNVEIYMSNVDRIASYHLGCVRAYFSSIHGTEKVSCFPSYLMTMFTGKSPDLRFVPGSKTFDNILGKYRMRGFHTKKCGGDDLEILNLLIPHGLQNRVTVLLNYIDIRTIFKMLSTGPEDRRSEHLGRVFSQHIEYIMYIIYSFNDPVNINNYKKYKITPCYSLLPIIKYSIKQE